MPVETVAQKIHDDANQARNEWIHPLISQQLFCSAQVGPIKGY